MTDCCAVPLPAGRLERISDKLIAIGQFKTLAVLLEKLIQTRQIRKHYTRLRNLKQFRYLSLT